jgi:hypothetical protein
LERMRLARCRGGRQRPCGCAAGLYEERNSHLTRQQRGSMVRRRTGLATLTAVLLSLAGAGQAWALPTMIRLGYSTCAACHVSPQGGGLLTPYGEGIDAAQSFRNGEEGATEAERLRRVLYDIRLQMGGSVMTSDAQDAAVKTSTMRLTFRNALLMSAHTRLSFQVGVETPSFGHTVGSASNAAAVLSKALFEYQPREGLAFAIGRDTLPSGLGLPDPDTYMRKQHDPLGTAYPLQAKAFISGRRMELTPYVFGPGLDEDRPLRQHGAGALAGVDVWKGRAIVGLAARSSRSNAFDRDAIGVYARLGFGRWGILAEHDFTARTTVSPAAQAAGYVTGYTQLFAAPFEWFVTSLIVDEVKTTGLGAKRVFRVAPTAQIRLSRHLTFVFSTREDFTTTVPNRSRTYSIGIAVKSVH